MSDTPPNLNAILDAAESGTPPTGDPPAPPTPSNSDPASSSTPAAPPPTGAGASTGEGEDGKFDRKYVEQLREEAKTYRLRAKDWNDVAGDLDDDGRNFLLDLNRALVAGDAATAQRLWDALNGHEPAGEPSAGDDVPLTASDVQRILNDTFARREAQQAETQAVQSIVAEAKTLGYEPDTRDYVTLLWTANNETDGDLKAAHDKLQTERQQIIDAWLADKEKTSKTSTTPAPPTGAQPSGEKPITSLKDARAGLEEFLAHAEL